MIGGCEGVFITFEGGEGSGKSTVCTKVFRQIGEQGYKCWKGGEPGGTVAGSFWREQILNPASILSPEAELCLFLADRAQNFAEHVAPKLAEGYIVMLDRHRDSTAAYQGGGRGHDLALIERMNDFATHNRRPDMTILLDIESDLGLARTRHTEYGAADRMEAEDIEFHKRLRGVFLALVEAEPERFVKLDASAPLDEVAARALKAVQDVLASKGVCPQ